MKDALQNEFEGCLRMNALHFWYEGSLGIWRIFDPILFVHIFYVHLRVGDLWYTFAQLCIVVPLQILDEFHNIMIHGAVERNDALRWK